MRLFSWNVNGVRAATKKGLFEWLEHESPDILCIQETKAHVDQLGPEILKTMAIMRIGIQEKDVATVELQHFVRMNLYMYKKG